MLYEIKHVRQIHNEARRRWFTSPELDLTVWYDRDNQLIGWQFCYDKNHAEHALSWYVDAGYQHTGVDDGERDGAMKSKATPMIGKNVVLDKPRVLALFVDNCQQLPLDIVQNIRRQIEEFA